MHQAEQSLPQGIIQKSVCQKQINVIFENKISCFRCNKWQQV